jgi:4-hydroxybenzoate polyprenyltransferase
MKTISSYFSLVTFAHTIFGLPFAITGFIMGVKDLGAWPEVSVILASLLCLIFARNSAMAFNRWADRHFDLQNPRTSEREIPMGTISAQSAIIFTLVNVILFVLSAYFINYICFILSPVAIFIVLGYSYIKRVSWLSHFVLGLGLMIAPVGAYMAVTSTLTADIFFLGLSVLFWVAGFDIIYSLQDTDFDKKHKLFSVPSVFGIKKAFLLSRICHLLTTSILLLWWILYHWAEWFTLIAIIFFILFVFRQHFIIRNQEFSRINRVFFTSNGLASLIFCAFYLLILI